jgi:hypothetical protein
MLLISSSFDMLCEKNTSQGIWGVEHREKVRSTENTCSAFTQLRRCAIRAQANTKLFGLLNVEGLFRLSCGVLGFRPRIQGFVGGGAIVVVEDELGLWWRPS